MSPNIVVGIDLGTTNTKCSIGELGSDGRLCKVIHYPIFQLTDKLDSKSPYDTEDILPSVVWIESANNVYTGSYCKFSASELASLPGSTVVKSIKRKMGNPGWMISVGQNIFYPRDISAFILLTVYKSILKQYTTDDINSITITIPASFSSMMREETLKAAKLAGMDLEKVALIDEPVAALFSRWNDVIKPSSPEVNDFTSMVVDIGGGTLDVSIILIRPDEKEVRVLSTSRYNEVAGDDIDLDLAALILSKVRVHPEYNGFLEFDSQPSNSLFPKTRSLGLLATAEYLKIDLGEYLSRGPRRGSIDWKIKHYKKEMSSLEVDFTIEFANASPKTLQIPVSTILSALSPLFKDSEYRNILIPVAQSLSRASLSPDQIDKVFVAGGSSSFPLVIDALTNWFNQEPVKLDPKYAVSDGAVNWSYHRTSGDWNLKDTLCDSLFLKRAGHPFLEILRAPIPVPSEQTDIDLTEEDCPHIDEGSNTVKLEIFQGESQTDPLMSLVHIETTTLPRKLAGIAKLIRIITKVDINKIIQLNLIFEDQDGVIEHQVEFKSETEIISGYPLSLPLPLMLNGEKI